MALLPNVFEMATSVSFSKPGYLERREIRAVPVNHSSDTSFYEHCPNIVFIDEESCIGCSMVRTVFIRNPFTLFIASCAFCCFLIIVQPQSSLTCCLS